MTTPSMLVCLVNCSVPLRRFTRLSFGGAERVTMDLTRPVVFASSSLKLDSLGLGVGAGVTKPVSVTDVVRAVVSTEAGYQVSETTFERKAGARQLTGRGGYLGTSVGVARYSAADGWCVLATVGLSGSLSAISQTTTIGSGSAAVASPPQSLGTKTELDLKLSGGMAFGNEGRFGGIFLSGAIPLVQGGSAAGVASAKPSLSVSLVAGHEF